MEENDVKQTNAVTESKGLSIASMVLGIVSVVTLCASYVSIVCAVLAIILGIIGRKKGGKGMAMAGLVLGIITLSIDILIVVFAVGFISEVFKAASMM